MKRTLVLCLIVIIIISCKNETENLTRLVQNGEFSKAIKIIDLRSQNKDKLSSNEIERDQTTLNKIQAIKREYTLSYDTLFKRLKKKIPDLSEIDMNKWENDYSLEFYIIDGEKRYYKKCIFDLFQVNKDAARRANIIENEENDASKYPLETINCFEHDSVIIKNINVGFTYFERIGNLPDSFLLKAWIPYIRENSFQSNIKIIRSSINNIVLPQKDILTSMIYFERVIEKNKNSNTKWRSYFSKPSENWIDPLNDPDYFSDSIFICHFIYEYKSKGFYKNIKPNDIQPYKISDQVYTKYIKEQESNLFTPYLKNLSKEIVDKETNNYLKAKKIYEWICKNVIWTKPKSVLGDWAEYTAKYKRGDCGSKSNLFISLCRINNIPARAQGGWLIQPDGPAQHTWAQVYFEPYGWLPVDVTMGASLINHKDERVKYFYFGNCTPYHMIISDDDSELLPKKVHDFINDGGSQCGAFEWEGGDIDPNVKIDSKVN